MRALAFCKRKSRHSERGQVMLFTVLALGIFLIGAMAFAIDLSNMWLNRQSAQTASDAACTAAAMDMLVGATNGTMPGTAHFTAGTAFDCNSASPTPAPCSYATLNGYNSSLNRGSANAGTLGNNVYVDFPTASSVGLSSLNLPSASVAAAPLVRVTVRNNISTWFAGLLRGMTSQSVGGGSICAVLQATSPIPILVLHPTNPGSLRMNGGGSNSNPGCGSAPCGDIVIAGGPSRSIQVNSSNASAVSLSGGPTIDLCAGGNNYCGSSMGIWGADPAPGSANFWTSSSTCSVQNAGLCTGSQVTPQWNAPSAPIADPLATYQAPGLPNFAGATHSSATGTTVGYHAHGCPDTRGCQWYTPGYYPNGICVGSPCGSAANTAIFDPGLYYLAGQACASGNGSLCERSGSCIRPSTDKGDGSGGTIFYFSDTHSVAVAGGGGSCNPPTGQSIDPFSITSSPTSTTTSYLTTGVKCTSSSSIPPNLLSVGSLTGSVLLAPCNTPDPTTNECSPNCSLNFGDPLGVADPYGEQRGVLFFQNRAVNATNNPSWSGNGSMLLAGTMYFHQCQTGGADTGLGCVSGAYGDILSLSGTSGSSTYVLGDIIVDQLSVGGSGQIVMDLNPSAAYTTLKAALVK